MRYATFIYEGKEHTGVYLDGYYPFSELLGRDTPVSLLEFIRTYENKSIPDFLGIVDDRQLKPLQQVTLRAPIPYPFRDIICLGKNYADHAKEVLETKLETQKEDFIPQSPVYFAKSACPAMGHQEKISLPEHFTNQIDYEAELAVIIGKTAKDVASDRVKDYIFGYTIINDLTARDIQARYGQWFFGKSLDGLCPMGPVIVSADEIAFPVELDISCKVNGRLCQYSNTSNLIFDIPRVVSELSHGMTLYPGDIIATGTPGGVGHAAKPPRYLQKGDEVECEIDKIGVLSNNFC